MEKVPEKFRLPEPGAARSDQVWLRNKSPFENQHVLWKKNSSMFLLQGAKTVSKHGFFELKFSRGVFRDVGYLL
jgi:hypothetical protein